MQNSERYQQIREQLKTGDVVAYSGRAFVGRMIRLATLSSYSHVGIILKLAGRVFVVEAREGKGVVLTPLSNTGHFSVLLQHADTPKIKPSDLLEQVGRCGYSYRNALRGWLGYPMRGTGYQCAQFVADHKYMTGALDNVTPHAVVERLLLYGYTMHSV